MASLSNCKAKLKEYSDNLDGHSFRAANYFKDELEARGIFINLEDTESVNSIKKLAPDLRQDSKAPTFAMAYMGGTRPIMNALKCSKAKAEGIVQAYKEIYPELEEFSQDTFEFAKEHGYVVGFYGLKLRCPSINSSDPEVVAHTLRTIVNMRIQSGAMLTVEAIADFQSYTENLGIAEVIRPHATIHDSVYYYIKEDPSLVKEVNTKLVELMVRPYPNQIVANEAELDIGRDWAHLEKGAVGKHTETKDYLEDTKVALENSVKE